MPPRIADTSVSSVLGVCFTLKPNLEKLFTNVAVVSSAGDVTVQVELCCIARNDFLCTCVRKFHISRIMEGPFLNTQTEVEATNKTKIERNQIALYTSYNPADSNNSNQNGPNFIR